MSHPHWPLLSNEIIFLSLFEQVKTLRASRTLGKVYRPWQGQRKNKEQLKEIFTQEQTDMKKKHWKIDKQKDTEEQRTEKGHRETEYPPARTGFPRSSAPQKEQW